MQYFIKIWSDYWSSDLANLFYIIFNNNAKLDKFHYIYIQYTTLNIINQILVLPIKWEKYISLLFKSRLSTYVISPFWTFDNFDEATGIYCQTSLICLSDFVN